jgi:acyl-CoA thioesterase FadM
MALDIRLAMPALPTLRYGKAGTDGHEIYQELNALTKLNSHYSKVLKSISFFLLCMIIHPAGTSANAEQIGYLCRPSPEDFDGYGHLNNARYCFYFRQGTEKLLDHFGVSQSFLRSEGISIGLRNARIEFKRQVEPENTLDIYSNFDGIDPCFMYVYQRMVSACVLNAVSRTKIFFVKKEKEKNRLVDISEVLPGLGKWPEAEELRALQEEYEFCQRKRDRENLPQKPLVVSTEHDISAAITENGLLTQEGYSTLFEINRQKLQDVYNVGDRKLKERGIGCLVKSVTIHNKRQALEGQKVVIYSSFGSYRNVVFQMRHELRVEDVVATEAITEHFFVEFKEGQLPQPIALLEELVKQLVR